VFDLSNMTGEDLLSYHNELAIHAKAKRRDGKFRTKAAGIKAIEALRLDLGSSRVERIEASLVDLTQPSAIGSGTLTEVTGYFKRAAPRRLLEQLHTGMGCDIGFQALLTSWFHHNGYFRATANLDTVVAAFRDYLGLEVAIERKV
jgi:hypothetical protein